MKGALIAALLLVAGDKAQEEEITKGCLQDGGKLKTLEATYYACVRLQSQRLEISGERPTDVARAGAVGCWREWNEIVPINAMCDTYFKKYLDASPVRGLDKIYQSGQDGGVEAVVSIRAARNQPK